jgi:hypothetical protein
MKQPSRIIWRSIPLLLAVALVVGSSHVTAEDFDTFLIPAAPAEPVPVAAPTPALAPAREAKPANKDAKKKEAKKLVRLERPIIYPSIVPNPLAFNMTWVVLTNKTLQDARTLAARKKAAARRAAVAQRPPANAAAQNAIEQQMRKLLEPMLLSELSFAARAGDLGRDERRKLHADGKAWFDKFVVDFIKKQDPNQQQMFLQGMQGVWFGNQQPTVESPRQAIRTGVMKLAKTALSKEKQAAYEDECRKRDEFARQVAVDNQVERLDEKVKLSPDQWKKITKTLNEHWDKKRDPQLEMFAQYGSMWPGVTEGWILPELSPAQQAVLKRINAMSGQMFINGGVFGQMVGGDVQVFNDMDDDATTAVARPAAEASSEHAEAE